MPAEHVNQIVFSPHQPDLLWVSLRDVGIFVSDDGGYVWEELADLPFDPVAGERVQTMRAGAESQLWVETALGIYRYESSWQTVVARTSAQQRLSLQAWIWRLHTGQFSKWGVLLYDASALALIFLSLSGLVLFRRPRRKRRLGQIAESKVEAANEFTA